MNQYNRHFDIIKRSHARSIEFGIEKERTVSKKILAIEEVYENIRKNGELIRIAAPLIKSLYDFLEGSGFMLFLTDCEGCILNVIGDNEIIAAANELNMIIGAYMDEKSIGTNAMGTAISEDSPIQISEKEHFINAYHRWTCSAAPIHNTMGQIIGTVNLTGASQLVHPHTLGLVVAAVKSIENQLKTESTQNKLIEAYSYNSAIMNSISYGVLAIDPSGKINSVNDKVCTMLGHTREKLLGISIEELITDWRDIFTKLIGGVNCQDDEISVGIGKSREKFIFNIHRIDDGNSKMIGMVLTFKEVQRVINLVSRYSGSGARYTFEDFIGDSEDMKRIVDFSKHIANSPATILIEGESGTGKEVLAQSIHNYSNRRNKPFVAINCGAISKNLIESELFGYEEGAFTGALKGGKPGKFELASGGTIFLDEIGEMPIELQVNLLRVLQEGYVTRLGGNKDIPVDVRVIAATNKALAMEVEKGTFRRDLYYRLSVLPINIPPLRERQQDLEPLIEHFLRKKALKLGKNPITINEDTIKWIYNNEWKGNVRELENFIEKLIILEDRTFTINGAMNKPFKIKADTRSEEDMFLGSLKELEKRAITAALKRFDNNITKVSENLGVSRNTLYLKMKKYNSLQME